MNIGTITLAPVSTIASLRALPEVLPLLASTVSVTFSSTLIGIFTPMMLSLYTKAESSLRSLINCPWSPTRSAERLNRSADIVGDQGQFIKDRSELSALVYNDNIIGVKIPIRIELKVTETVDASKGNTSGNALKEAIVETGAKVMVPMFINQGDIIAVNTEDGNYSERVEKA